jgi:hypothetical protein
MDAEGSLFSLQEPAKGHYLKQFDLIHTLFTIQDSF